MLKQLFPENLVCEFEVRPAVVGSGARSAEQSLSAELSAAGLAKLGISETAVGRGPAGEPIWPPGVCGSLAHTRLESGEIAGICLLAKVPVRSLGVDLEDLRRQVNPDLGNRIALPAEQASTRLELLRLFSAKEATYKAFYPLVKKFFGFKDAELIWNAEREIFSGRLLVELPPYPLGQTFTVYSKSQENLLFSYVLLS